MATENGIRYFIGASRDGVGVDRLQDYEKDLTTQNGADPYGLDGDDSRPFTGMPQLYLDPDVLLDANEGVLVALWRQRPDPERCPAYQSFRSRSMAAGPCGSAPSTSSM